MKLTECTPKEDRRYTMRDLTHNDLVILARALTLDIDKNPGVGFIYRKDMRDAIEALL